MSGPYGESYPYDPELVYFVCAGAGLYLGAEEGSGQIRVDHRLPVLQRQVLQKVARNPKPDTACSL